MKKTIKSKQEFGEVFHNGKRASSKLVRISAINNEGDSGRVAFVAAKRLGNAVYRNHCKRILREAARMCGLPKDGYSIIMFATKRTFSSKPNEVACELEKLINKIEN